MTQGGGVPMKVLIVDDDPVVRQCFDIVAKRDGYRSLVAADGAEALQVFRRDRPDIVVSDIEMPKMNGLQMLEAIRAESADTIVVMMTGAGSESYALQALRLRANNYLNKPINLADLRQLLDRYARVIEGRTIEREITGKVVSRHVVYQFETRVEHVPKMSDVLLQEAAGGLDPAARLEVRLGLSEMLLNAMEHGNLEISYDDKTALLNDNKDLDYFDLLVARQREPRFAGRKVVVEVALDEHACTWTITDEGRGFDWRSLPNPQSDSALVVLHGRGIILARFQFDEVSFLGDGNCVCLVKKRRSGMVAEKQ